MKNVAADPVLPRQSFFTKNRLSEILNVFTLSFSHQHEKISQK